MNKGLTLIDLMVVFMILAIIAIMASVIACGLKDQPAVKPQEAVVIQKSEFGCVSEGGAFLCN